jgi:hypothetical protein
VSAVREQALPYTVLGDLSKRTGKEETNDIAKIIPLSGTMNDRKWSPCYF